MELDVSYTFENEQQFWDELEDIVSKDYENHGLIDNALRSYLSLTTDFRGDFVTSEYDVARCSLNLISSALFEKHAEYIRRQMVYCLLQDDNPDVLRVVTSCLLADARQHEQTYELLNHEGGFLRLVDLISHPKKEAEAELHRLPMELLYEMSRIQRITNDNLANVDDNFVRNLFQIIEEASDDVDDPYHYPVIRVLLVLNEQYMVAAHDPSSNGHSSPPLTNKIIKILSSEGSKFKTFGENIILLLNRETETSLQLLTLKLLYLLFTTPLTYEYFYTNDLRVLVDILIRNLLDLPEDAAALRHTNLRVLYPLLAHTQLRYPPQYKRDEIRKLLSVLARGQVADAERVSPTDKWQYFEEVDETTLRLVGRCQKVAWLADPEVESTVHVESSTSTDSPSSPTTSLTKLKLVPELPAPRKLTKRNSSKASGLSIAPYLTPQLQSARSSSLSVLEVAIHREKPGVITPSRKDGTVPNNSAQTKREKPALPKARRSGWGSKREQEDMKLAAEKVEAEQGVQQGEVAEKSTAENLIASLPEPTLTSSAKDSDPTAVTKPAPPTHKQPRPPAPKTRRWRGKAAAKVDDKSTPTSPATGSAIRNVHFRSISATHPSRAPPKPDFAPLPRLVADSEIGTTKTLVHPDSDLKSPPPSEKASVATALEAAQQDAEASLSETLERQTLASPLDAHDGKDAVKRGELDAIHEDRDTFHEAQQQQQQPVLAGIGAGAEGVPRVVLAPPSPAPPRSVPGPRWEVERSPFLDEEGDEGEGEGREDE